MRLEKYRHMVKSTSQFVKEIRNILPRENHTFYKVDVKDYFMSGDASQLLDGAVKIAYDKLELNNWLRRA